MQTFYLFFVYNNLYNLNKKTPAAQEQSSAATYEHLWCAFSGYLRQELKKLELATGVIS